LFSSSTGGSLTTPIVQTATLQHPTSASTDGQLDRLADTTEHFNQRVDGELGRFLVHHVGHARARDHPNVGGLGLLQVMFCNPGGQLFHQLLFQEPRVIDLFTGRSLQALGFVRRKTQLQVEIRAQLCHMADFGVYRHFFAFFELTTAR